MLVAPILARNDVVYIVPTRNVTISADQMFELYVDGVQDISAQYFANPEAVSTVVLAPSASTLAVMGNDRLRHHG